MNEQQQVVLSHNGITVTVFDDLTPGITHGIFEEALKFYLLDTLVLGEGETVVEIGANVGQLSVWLAKKFPLAKVIAVEPVWPSYCNLLSALQFNGITNVIPVNVGVSESEYTLQLLYSTAHACATSFTRNKSLLNDTKQICHAVTIEQLFAFTNVSSCKCLIVDCEGAEHEIARSPVFDKIKVDCFMGELHENTLIRQHGWSNLSTLSILGERFSRVNVVSIGMSE